MDLVAGVKKIVVIMDHADKAGSAKFVRACTLPLTGAGVVDLLITDLAVFTLDRRAGPVRLVELAPGVGLDEVAAKTEAAYEVALSPA